MSSNISNYISNLLSIKDTNITFFDNIYTKKINNLNTIVHNAILSCNASSCLNCGNHHKPSIIKYGFKNTIVRISSINSKPACINLKKQRFLCKEFNSTFIAETNILAKFLSISRDLKMATLDSLSKKISEKDIASLHNLSHSTVSRYIDSDFRDFTPNKNFLTNHLSFDEFKSSKDCKCAVRFIKFF